MSSALYMSGDVKIMAKSYSKVICCLRRCLCFSRFPSLVENVRNERIIKMESRMLSFHFFSQLMSGDLMSSIEDSGCPKSLSLPLFPFFLFALCCFLCIALDGEGAAAVSERSNFLIKE